MKLETFDADGVYGKLVSLIGSKDKKMIKHVDLSKEEYAELKKEVGVPVQAEIPDFDGVLIKVDGDMILERVKRQQQLLAGRAGGRA